MSVAVKELELTWKANLEALKLIQPYLIELLEQRAEDLGLASWTVSYKGPYVELRDVDGKLRFVENTGLCYNCINENVEGKSAIVLGLGLGEHFLTTFDSMDENIRFICCESHIPLLYWALHLHDFSRLISKGKLFFVVGEKRADREAQWRRISPWVRLMGKIEPSIYIHKQYSGSDISKMKQFLSEYRGMLLSTISTSTIPLFRNLTETAQTAVNAYIYRDKNIVTLEEMQEHWKGRPAIVVSAGPSLDRQVELLRKAQYHCVIVANDVITYYLMEKGIMPHVVAALDYSHIVYKKLEKAIKFLSSCDLKPVLAFGSKVYPKLIYEWPGPLFPNKSDAVGPKVCEILGLNPLDNGSSVAHFCYSIAQAICPEEVIFVGQDLAYGEEGRSHSVGFAEGSAPADLGLEITSWDGRGTVKTNRHWYGFLSIFEHLITASPVPVYNCTEGGAKINGAIHVPFKERLDVHVEVPAPPYLKGSRIENIGLTSDNQRRILKLINGVLKDTEDIRKEFLKVKRLPISRSVSSIKKTYGAALETWRDIFYHCEFLRGAITSLRFSSSGDILSKAMVLISNIQGAKEIADLFLDDVEFARVYLQEIKSIWSMFSPIFEKKCQENQESRRESGSMQMHELWLAVASSGERPWWSVFLNAEDVNYEIFLELVAKAHGAHLQAPLNQMIEDIQERVPSWLYDLSRSWYDFLYHGHFEKYLMFLRSYHKAEQFLAATESSMGWLEIMASFLPAQLRALAPFVKFSDFNDEADTSLLADMINVEALYWEGRRREFLSELSKLLDKFKAERKVALAIASAGRGTWVTSLVIRTLNACLCARVPAEKYQEKFSEAFGIHVKLQPQNAD